MAREHVGQTREEVTRAWLDIEHAPRERRILSRPHEARRRRLASSRCRRAWSLPALRSELFLEAALRRRADDPTAFDRDTLVAEFAERHAMPPDALEAALFADLRGAHRLVTSAPLAPEALVERYREAQVQAVLLRAVRVVAEVRCASPDAYRELFRKLKFRRLLHRTTPLEDGGYRIEIDGPFSLFQGVAKYGLELALTLPALEACSSLELEGDGALVRAEPRAHLSSSRRREARGIVGHRRCGPKSSSSSRRFARSASGWSASAADRIFDLPGLGVCVPDLRLVRERDQAEAFVEVLGYWSRASVWKRVELAEHGLGAKILFAVSSRLRVSEEVLDESDSAALYVYKGKINPQALLRKSRSSSACVE